MAANLRRTRVLLALVLVVMLAGGAGWQLREHEGRVRALLFAAPNKPDASMATELAAPATTAQVAGRVSAWTFVRARPGQRDRLERFLVSNWLALDEEAAQQSRIAGYRMLKADADPKETSWDFAVVIDYADRQAMTDFVPFYLALARERPHKRIDGLDFPDLGQVIEQRVVESVSSKDDALTP